MRYFLVSFLLLIACYSFSVNVEQCQTMNNVISVKLNQIKSKPDLAVTDDTALITSQTYALPYSNCSIQINNMQWDVYNNQGTFVRSDNSITQSSVYVSNTFTFREMYGITVNIKNQIPNGSDYRVLNSVEFDVVGYNPIPIPQAVSPAFVKSYQKLAANYETSYLRNLPIARPKLLIISHTDLTPQIGAFVRWKQSKGFEVTILNKQSIGNNSIAIRDSIRAYYNQNHYDFLLLLGDVTGAFAIPTNIYASPLADEHDADDNYYTMLEGDDYFPEMLVGRFSFTGIDGYLTIANKTKDYEKAPSMSDPSWMRRGLVVAGNHSEQAPFPVTPVQMSRWLREKMLSKGYAQVDSVFDPPTYPGTANILSSINNGVQYISYRGWGAADGWHYPYFHVENLDNLINGSKMPIVFSIVCNTGDFNNDLNPCFGEKWMLMGTSGNRNGCVAFVGPSDLHTKTNLNNTISTGIYSSIFDDGERNFGASVLAGKIELYKNYPNDLASDGNVAFYFHVYNILSDPSMNMWMLVPATIPSTVITDASAFSQSDSNIRIEASNLNGAIVTGTKNFIDYTYTVVHDGVAVLPVNPEQTGNLLVTISKENFVPLVVTLTPDQNPTLGITANSLNGQLINAGQSYSVSLSVKNYSASALTGVAANLSASPAGLLTIQNPNQTIANLASLGTSTLTYNFTVNGNVAAHKIIRFDLDFPNQTSQSSFELTTGGAEFAIMSSQGNLNIGSTNTISYTIKNIGTFDIQNATVNIQSLNNAASIGASNVSIGNLAVNQTAVFQSQVTIEPDCYNGRNILFYFTVSNPSGYESSCYYSLTAGNPTVADPTGPDQYGYFAYDSFDVNYPLHPTYEWTEIDTDDVDSEVHLIVDDGSYTVNLPFTFKYYGHDYSQMTICSNGWVSFVPTWMADFNNLYIPAALGPYAMVAPYWDDLKGLMVVQDSLHFYFNDMRICNWYDSENNRYIVEWNNAYNNYTIESTNPSLEKFQLILYPNNNRDGDIVFQYHTIDNPAVSNNYSTVGIENHLQNDGLTYTYANFYPVTATHLQAGLAVKFTTTPPDSFVVNEDMVQSILPFDLKQNYPNPFNPETKISFNLKNKADVNLEIFNLKGQKIRTLVAANMSKGQHQIVWNGKDDNGINVSSGVYIYKMKSSGFSQMKKMILMK